MKVEYQQKFFRISLQRSATIAISDHLVRRGEINNRNINRIKHRVSSAALRNFHSGFFFSLRTIRVILKRRKHHVGSASIGSAAREDDPNLFDLIRE
jgi:hypothetical protein